MDTQLSGDGDVFFQIIAAGKDRLVIYQKFGKAQLPCLMNRTVYALTAIIPASVPRNISPLALRMAPLK